MRRGSLWTVLQGLCSNWGTSRDEDEERVAGTQLGVWNAGRIDGPVTRGKGRGAHGYVCVCIACI